MERLDTWFHLKYYCIMFSNVFEMEKIRLFYLLLSHIIIYLFMNNII